MKNEKMRKNTPTVSIENESLKRITKLATELAALTENADLPRVVSRKLKELTHATFVSFGLYLPETKQIAVLHIETENRLLNTFRKISGKDSFSVLSPVDDQTYSRICQEVVGYCDTLSDVTFGAISPVVSAAVQKVFSLDRFTGMAYIYDNKLYGTSVLGFRKNEPQPAKEFLVSVSSLISVTILRWKAEQTRKHAEEALKESEKKFRTVVEEAVEIVFTVDARGYFTYVNPSGLRSSGYSLDEIKQMKYIDLIEPEYKQRVKTGYFKQYLERGSTTTTEYPFRAKSGEIKWFNQNARLIIENDEITGFYVIARDVTERRKAENALKESEAKFRVLTETAPSAIFIFRGNNMIYANPATEILSGYSYEEILEMRFWDIVHPDFKELAKNRGLERQRGETIPDSYEVKILRKDGQEKWVQYAAESIIYEGEPAILGTAFDITEKKQMVKDLIAAKEKSQESDRLKSAFLANMSHEIRTPMNGILGFSELLKEPDLTDTEKVKYIQIISRNAQKLLTIINDIVDISKIEAGLEALHPEEFDLNNLLEELIAFFQPQVEQKQIALSRTSCEHLANQWIIGDKTKLWQVLVNLIGNAIKFTSAGCVEVACSLNNQHLVLKVRDTGIGIDPQLHEVIFDRFRQAETSTTRNFGGTGLGLSITKSYVDMMGGAISVESTPGRGSTFTVHIPYQPA